LPPELSLRRHHFVELLARSGRAAPEHVPLVILRDRINTHDANHHHDFCSLYVIRGGRGTHVIDGTAYGVARGDVYVMGPEMTHYFRDGENLTADTLHFSPAIFDRATLDALAETPGFHSLFVGDGTAAAMGQRWLHLTPAAYENVVGQVAELRAEWSRTSPDCLLLTRCLFLRLLVHLSRLYAEFATTGSCALPATVPTIPSPDPHEATVAAALRFMDEHFVEPLRIEQVAAQVFLSPDRFTEVFARTMGRTPRDYLRHLRLERAKELLVRGDMSVAEVARLSGFTEAGYLTRVLRGATGLTPRDYRKNPDRLPHPTGREKRA
jgi:AraC family L-rhamnose operon regulatory protein RhaS